MDKFTSKFDDFSLDVKKNISKIHEGLEQHASILSEHDSRLDILKSQGESHAQKIQEILEGQKTQSARIEKALEDHKTSMDEATASVREASAPPRGLAQAPGPSGNSGGGSPTKFFKTPGGEHAIEFNVEGNGLFSKDEVVKVLNKVLEDLALAPNCFTLEGSPNVARRFVASFNSPTAEEDKVRVLRARKDAGGEWVQFMVPTPGGSTPLTRMYFAPAKSPAQKRREGLCKKFAAHLHSTYPDCTFFDRRGSGVVTIGGQPLVVIQVEEEKASLLWKHRVLGASPVNKVEMDEWFHKEFNWCP